MNNSSKKASSKNAKVERAFNFLKSYAESRQVFTLEEFAAATGWAEGSARTYISKLWRDFLTRANDGYLVSSEFGRMSWEEFKKRFSQRRPVYATYDRIKYDEVVAYEFLLPLTREDRLKQALDDLFYSDTIERRLRTVGVDKLSAVIVRQSAESEDEYIGRICGLVSDKFGGYSISQVSGRFRAGDLTSRKTAGEMLANDQRYLIDETTAVVRFIIPCKTTRVEHDGGFDSLVKIIGEGDGTTTSKRVDDEICLIRFLFFVLFVEAVVRTVDGEDEIWLLETGPVRRLYVWEANRD